MVSIDQEGFLKFLNGLGKREYLFSVIAYGVAPTLLSNKPSTLLNLQNSSHSLHSLWHIHKEEICHTLDLDFFILKEGRSSSVVLFYRNSLLDICIQKPDNRLFLESRGYEKSKALHDYLKTLKYRFQFGCPHEIGLFLGFPLHDVVGFIDNNGQNSLLSRYWKVYDRLNDALGVFSSYDKARHEMRSILVEFSF